MLFFAKRKDADSSDFRVHFELNDPIKLEYRGKYYSSRVEDMGEDQLTVAWPSSYGVSLRIADGDRVTIVSSVRSGMQGFRADIVRRSDGPPAILDLRPVEDLGKVQRRDYVRVPETLTVTYRVLGRKPNQGGDTLMTGTTKNISGGGMLLSIDKKDRPMPKDTLELQFQLPESTAIRATGSVIRVAPADNTVETLYEMAVQFAQIHEQDRKMVIKRVFAREAELRSAGLM